MIINRSYCLLYLNVMFSEQINLMSPHSIAEPPDQSSPDSGIVSIGHSDY